MSRDILREMVSAIKRLRVEPTDHSRIEEWAARLEEHLLELECLATHIIPDAEEPAFEAVPSGAAKPVSTPGPDARIREVLPSPPADMKPGRSTTLTAALRLLRTRQLSSEMLLEQHLKRIRDAGKLNAFIAVFEEQARREAQAADRALASGSAGLLSGIPVAVKDLMRIRGYAMTGGSRALRETPSPDDAEVVARLRTAGAVILGAANLHELAYGVTSENPHFGAVGNPRRPEHMAGGSSGGSAAAVAAHLALGAIGTDTGGSIRIPAAACGVVGLKPTYGRVTRRGVLPLSWSLDHVGPLAPACADAAVLMAVMADSPLQEERAFTYALTAPTWPAGNDSALSPPLEAAARLARAMAGEPGSDGQHSTSAGMSIMARLSEMLIGMRVGRFPDEWLHPLHNDAAQALESALETLREAGLTVSVVEPLPMALTRAAQFVVLQAEAATIHRERLRARPDDLGPDVRLRLQLGEFLLAVDYLQGQRLRRQVANDFLRLFDRVDVLVLPALPVAAPRLGTRLVTIGNQTEPVHRALTRYTYAFNQSGLPALAVPVGTDAAGLPLAVQIVGRPFGELDILRVGIALEAFHPLP